MVKWYKIGEGCLPDHVEDRDWVKVVRRDGSTEKGQMQDLWWGDNLSDDPKPDDVIKFRHLAKDDRA